MSEEMSFAAILNYGRMISDGIHFSDIQAAEKVADSGEDVEWFDFWMQRADYYEALAQDAIDAGNTVSGGEWMWSACLAAHYAQFMWFHVPERREAGQRRKVELFDRAAPHFVPAGERVEIPFEGNTIPGYLRLPQGATDPVACCVLIGGLESTKEESHLFENLCLRRGMAIFAFDGPGQGELFFDVKLVGDFERYSSAVVDYLVDRDEIDAGRIGVLGRSLGGHYAPKAASGDERFAACCAWGACFDLSDYPDMPEHTQHGFRYATGIADEEKAVEHLLSSLDLAPVADQIRCPTLLTHGVHDTIFSMAQVDKYREGLTNSELTVQVEQDGDHCCHNMGQIIRPQMVDWMANQLGARA
ncbi:MAG: alpha/beta hydrolase family protein [Solirubrobacterales bacterium]